MKKGLEPLYTGPYQVLERYDKYFTIKTLTQKILKILLLQIQIRATIVQREQNAVTMLRARSSRLL